ncbi:hypothetical protein B0H16DRAFT_1691974 [Mycena metata]|uniref:Uncharacterized protein n=1 Tax=Mycena metata TaxID=1033252 RepID=A0AAD7ISB3_9AGAR|nr:hypothetical protein B0H16DRAFT_1691974 [Mycena metata]
MASQPQAGSRKLITYSHKRSRSRPATVSAASSPLPELNDPDQYTSHAELSRRLLKRARRSSNPEVFSSKKFKTSAVTPAGSPMQYETPHPSLLTEEQKFRLNSSRGVPVHPDQFSPLPVGRRISRTASRNLKENASIRAQKKSKLLDSPFNSRPSSAASSPQKSQPVSLSQISTQHSTHKPFKRTLSDTHYNPNIPQSASTTNSPTHAHSPLRARRPSAPSPPRPNNRLPKEAAPGSFDFKFHSGIASPFFLSSATNDIDFNRPPSSLSFYGDFGDTESQFFDEVQGVSTPATKKRAQTLGSAVADDDEALDEPDLTITQHIMDVDIPHTVGMKALPTRERSPWLSDSLISPPASQEWKRPPQENAYTHSPTRDVDMYDELSLGLGLPPNFGPPVSSDRDDKDADEPNAGEHDLKNMFDGLALATKNRFLNGRTRSLESPSTANDDPEQPKPKGRDRRGTIRASDFKTTFAPVRRTRSGTVIGPPAPLQRARSLNGPDSAAIGEVSEDEELNGWCADGWVVAAPPSPVVSRKRPPRTTDANMGSPDRSDELDTLSKASGLLPSPVLHFKKKGKVVTKDVVMEEEDEDDELLLKPGLNVWE